MKQYPIEAAIVFYNSYLAERNGDHFFPNSDLNGASDAFRHYVWEGLLTRDLGEETAQKFLNAHELNSNQPFKEKEMNELNNQQGIKAAYELLKNYHFEDNELFEKAKTDIENGRLRILNYENKKNNYYFFYKFFFVFN